VVWGEVVKFLLREKEHRLSLRENNTKKKEGGNFGVSKNRLE